jgi:DNA-binding transcriptional ArsR family regulator
LAAGSIQEQPGEKLDRLGLLPRREAGKPRTAEPKLGIAQNNLPTKKKRQPMAAAEHEGAGAEKSLYIDKGRNAPRSDTPPRGHSAAGRRKPFARAGSRGSMIAAAAARLDNRAVMEFRDALHEAYAPNLAALDVLDQPTRRLIVGLIAREPGTVGRLCRLLGLSQPLVSKHVRILLDAGLLDVSRSPRDGRVRVYRLRRQPFAELEAWLADIRADWHERTRHRADERDEQL